MTVLSLAYNKLDSAKGLERIMGLKELDLRHNLIIDPNGVSYLGSLPLLTDLWLDGNPLSGEKGYFPQVYAFFKDNKNKMRLDDRLPTPAECEEIEEVKKFFKPAPKKMITDQVNILSFGAFFCMIAFGSKLQCLNLLHFCLPL